MGGRLDFGLATLNGLRAAGLARRKRDKFKLLPDGGKGFAEEMLIFAAQTWGGTAALPDMRMKPTHFRAALTALLLTAVLTAGAQTVRQAAAKAKRTTAASGQTVYAQRMDSLIRAFRADTFAYADTLSNPYYVTLLTRPQVYDASLTRIFGIDYSPGTKETERRESPSGSVYDIVAAADTSLLYVWAQYPAMVTVPAGQTAEARQEERPQAERQEKEKVTLSEHLDAPVTAAGKEVVAPGDDIQIVVRKPDFWTFKTNFSLQFTQNYVSDNWYKGGESHYALLAATVIEANFDNRQKLTFDNKLEMKLGFQSSRDDKEHAFKTNSDLLRLTNKVGWQAAKRWYYTMMLQSWTQFYRGYKSNDPKVYSDFMSPFESVLSVGMDYKFTSDKKTSYLSQEKPRFSVTATLSPVAVRFKYVDRPSLATSFGLEEGRHTDWSYGSNVTVNYTWCLMKNVSWTSRVYFFTDYSSVQVEWENTFNLAINRYLSTKLFLYPRYDDSRTREAGVSDFEFNELLSLGLEVSF